MTALDRPLEGGPPIPTSRGRTPGWLTTWGPAVVSFMGALGYSLFLALGTYEVDLGVYLRLGARYAFTTHLYSSVVPNTNLLFTYPPFAALLFVPWQAFPNVHSVQAAWTLCNLAALIALLVLSLRLVKPDLSRGAAWRLGLLLSLPAMLLNPVVITVAFGQVNLVVTLLVMWDLLSERRIGSWQAPLGVATGVAAAVKLTPLFFVPYLILTRRTRGAITCSVTFLVCEGAAFLLTPTSSRVYWTHALFRPGRAGQLSYVGNQNLLAAVERLHHGLVTNLALAPVLLAVAAGGLWLAALAHRRSSPMLGLLVCAATGLVVSPISWVHHLVWVVPAILWLALGEDRPRVGIPLAIGTAVLFWIAPVWWVPYVGTSDLHLNAWQLAAGNSFFFALLVFLVGTAILLVRRRAHRERPGAQLMSRSG